MILQSLLALSLIFAILGVESTSFAHARFGTGFSVLFSSFATFLLGSISLALFQLVALGTVMLTLLAMFENKFNVTRDIDPLKGPVPKIILLSTAISIFLIAVSISSSYPDGAAAAFLSVAVCALILKRNILKIVISLIILQCSGSIVMMLLNVSALATVAFNLGVMGLEFFLVKYAFDIQRMHGTLNSRRIAFRSSQSQQT